MQSANQLPAGSYMESKKVIDFCYSICKPSLAQIIEKILIPIEDENGFYHYKVQDLKNVMHAPLFREMECNVTTLMIV